MNDDQIQRLLQDLVQIPSVSPHGDPGTAQKNTGEAQIAEYIAEVLRKLALDVELREIEPGRPNIIGKFTSRGAKRSVAFAPHTDTVSVAGMTIDPFAAEIRDGKLYGRGACDAKGPLAAMLAALANAVRKKEFREGDLDVYFCAVMGEESGNYGAKALAESGFKVDFAVAGEPTEGRIVYTHKGALWCKIVTRGRSAHGSLPEKGVNAIGKMAEVVRYLLGDYTHVLAKAADPVLGAPTVNVGTIRGGTQSNIVPDYCEIEVDRRTVPGENHEEILATLRQTFHHVPITTEILSDCPPLRTDPQNAFVQKLAEATGHPESALVGAPWFCDAGILAQYGVPAVAFGPDNIAQAHTADEFVECRKVLHAAQVLERFLLSDGGNLGR
ncbi:MAG TPA: M20 family metallopeptidase [Verrucomicrobiae bacterium]|nr:M20 family metallopeptidase [Verrucomicrobiae bacterium]